MRHLKTAPYHPASRGLTGRAVQTVKSGIRHMTGGDLESKVVRYLSRYRFTPQSTTGSSPAQLLMRRQIRTKLDLINPKLSDRVFNSQNNQKKQHGYHAIERSLDMEDPVFCDNFSRGDRWLPGCIIQKPGPLSYVTKLPDCRIICRHHDHVRIRSSAEVSQDNIPDDNMILPATVPVDTHVPISIVPS